MIGLCDESIMVFNHICAGEVIKAGADFDKLCEPFYHILWVPLIPVKLTGIFFYLDMT